MSPDRFRLIRGPGRVSAGRSRLLRAGGFLRAAESLEERICYRIPSDPYMKPPARVGDPPNPQWDMEKIHALDAWNLYSGNKVNVVAVMDYGVDYAHVDFGSSLTGAQGNLWDRGRIFANYAQRGYDEINYGSAASQPAGATKPAAADWLGNHAAGIIGAVTNNRLGVSGINWVTQIYSSKILDGAKTPTVGVISTAIDHIIAMRSSNRSEQLVRAVAFGWSTTKDFGSPMAAFGRLVQGPLAAPDKGVLVTIPAGDSGPNTRNYPAAYKTANDQNVLVVGATDKDDQPWSGNSNVNNIDIYAPGVSIISVGAAGSGYQTVTGTREAAAHVAGAISLIYEAGRVNGKALPWTDVKDAIINGADVVNGIRRLNIMGSLKFLGLDTRPAGNGPILTLTGGSGPEGNAGLSAATFTVAMDRTYSTPVTFAVQVSDGTAQLVDNDYAAVSPDGKVLVTIPANQLSASFTVQVVGDRKIENDETITATLVDLAASANVAAGTATWTIVNDDAYPVVAIAGAVSVAEGNSGIRTVQIPVTLSAASLLPITVSFAVTPGTATAGSDYIAPPTGAKVTFAAGQTTQWIPLSIVGNAVANADKTLTLTLSAPANATLGAASSTVTIVDEETPVISVAAVQTAALVGATGRLVFTVSLSTAATVPVTVNFAAVDGTAVNGIDYTLAAGSLAFAVGERTKTIVVALAPRRVGQSYPKTFTLKLSGLSGAKFGPASGADSAVGTLL